MLIASIILDQYRRQLGYGRLFSLRFNIATLAHVAGIEITNVERPLEEFMPKAPFLSTFARAVIFSAALAFTAPAVAQQAAELNAMLARYKQSLDAGDYASALAQAQKLEVIVKERYGPGHPNYAVSLNGIAIVYERLGKYAEAENLYKRALTIKEKAVGADHPDMAPSLNNLANVYLRQGKYAEAEALYKRTAAINEKTLGANHPDVATTLNNLATVYKDQARYAEAANLHKRVLAIREKALGSDHPNVAGSLQNLASVYNAQGKFADAERDYKRALAIQEKVFGENHPDVALILHNLADNYDDQGRYSEAETLLERALAIREKILGPNHTDVADTLQTLAAVYSNLGRYADAETLLKRSLAIAEKALGPSHGSVAGNLSSLGDLYRNQGRYSEAEMLLKRALSIREQALGANHPSVATSLSNLSIVFEREGKYADAEGLQKRALAIREKVLGADNPDVATSLNNLAIIYQKQDRYAEAENLLQRALSIREKALGPNNSDVAQTLNNLANNYTKQDRYAEAERIQRRALDIKEKILGANHPSLASSLNNIAAISRLQGKYADAEGFYKRALSIREAALGANHPDVTQTVNNLAEMYGAQNKYAEALPLVKRAMASAHAKPAVALPVLDGARENKLLSVAAAMDDGLNIVQHAAQTSTAAAVNKLAARLAAGGDRLAQLVRRDQDLAAEADALDKALIAAVLNESRRDKAAEQRMRDRLATIAKERAELHQTFVREFPDYAALSNPAPLTVKEVQAQLSPDEAMVVFAVTDYDRSYVFAITRERADWQPIPLGAQAFSDQVAAFRNGLDLNRLNNVPGSAGTTELFDLGIAHDLYKLLFEKIEPLVRDKKQWLVVPAGALTALPFHLLVTDAPAVAKPTDLAGYREASWLLKRQAVTVLPSIVSLKVLRSHPQALPSSKPMIGFGDPVFDPASGGAAGTRTARAKARKVATRAFTDFWNGAGVDRDRIASALPRLPETADELKAIARTLKVAAADIHLGRDASENRVKATKLDDYRIVYFATHGLVAGDVKGLAEPSLALSIPKQPSDLDDGLLTASEIAQLKLNADWVVLSACNTIAGEKPGAEALSGLARAFFYAGARALLVTHWAVDSAAATRLTTSIFDKMNANAGMGRSEALRQALLDFMNDPSEQTNAYPAYWAPFVIVGNGR